MSERFGFDEAIRRLKAGKKLQRAGWNGKGMWIALTPEACLDIYEECNGVAAYLADEALRNGGEGIVVNAHLDMRAADGSLVIGWLASQTDMLADDWQEVV